VIDRGNDFVIAIFTVAYQAHAIPYILFIFVDLPFRPDERFLPILPLSVVTLCQVVEPCICNVGMLINFEVTLVT